MKIKNVSGPPVPSSQMEKFKQLVKKYDNYLKQISEQKLFTPIEEYFEDTHSEDN